MANEGFLDVLFRDSKLTMLLSESLGNINCQTTMIAHISDSPVNYMETLTTVQLASRIHRMRKKKSKVLQVVFVRLSAGRISQAGKDQFRTLLNNQSCIQESCMWLYVHSYSFKLIYTREKDHEKEKRDNVRKDETK